MEGMHEFARPRLANLAYRSNSMISKPTSEISAAPTGAIVIYKPSDADVRLDVRLEGETVWLSTEQMGRLFQRDRSVIGKHLRNVFTDGELSQKSNVQNLPIARSDKPVAFYNLDAIISVGYRVKSAAGVRFRQWATRTLREHLVKGYTLNQKRLAERGLSEARQTLDLLARTLTRASRWWMTPAAPCCA